MERKEFRIKKRLGQNFLTNDGICEKIVNFAEVEGKVVVEIGPGFGALTKHLVKRADFVIAIEKDLELVPFLKKEFGGRKNFKLVVADFLKLDLENVFKKEIVGKEVVVCANLPYYITTPILIKILKSDLKISAATLMVQKEVADRLIAKPGDNGCGSISVFVDFYAESEILFRVSKNNFSPRPKVDSAVFRLKRKDIAKNKVEDEEFFFKLVRTAFSQRRKMFFNPVCEMFGFKKEDFFKILDSLGIDKSKRAQSLTFEEFRKISNFLCSNKD